MSVPRPGRPRGPKPKVEEREAKMLASAVDVMHSGALRGLREMMSLSDLAKAAGLSPRTIKNDWKKRAGERWPDDFITSFVRTHLYGADAPWIAEFREKTIREWLENDRDDPRTKFKRAIATNYETLLEARATIPRWQVHLVAAATLAQQDRSSGNGDAETSSNGASVDHKLAMNLVNQRIDFYENVSDLWLPALGVVLADMAREPKPGMTPELIMCLLHTLLNGLVLRRLLDDDAFGEDCSETVSIAMLALLEGLTEPHAAANAPNPDSIDAWVVDKSIECVISTHRVQGNEGATSIEAIQLTDIYARMVEKHSEWRPSIEAVFRVQFPDLTVLRDAAVRRLLAGRVGAAMDMVSTDPDAVLQQVLLIIRDVRESDGFLLQACIEHRASGSSSYLADLESHLVTIMQALGTNVPDRAASGLLEAALTGNQSMVETVMALSSPPR